MCAIKIALATRGIVNSYELPVWQSDFGIIRRQEQIQGLTLVCEVMGTRNKMCVRGGGGDMCASAWGNKKKHVKAMNA